MTYDDEPKPDTSPWMICPVCEGEGKHSQHSQHLGDFTMSEFNETFDDEDSREAYFNGDYDRVCTVCNGTGKIRESEADKVSDYYERDRIARTGRNSYGEPC